MSALAELPEWLTIGESEQLAGTTSIRKLIEFGELRSRPFVRGVDRPDLTRSARHMTRLLVHRDDVRALRDERLRKLAEPKPEVKSEPRRIPRCRHKFAAGLCEVRGCQHQRGKKEQHAPPS